MRLGLRARLIAGIWALWALSGCGGPAGGVVAPLAVPATVAAPLFTSTLAPSATATLPPAPTATFTLLPTFTATATPSPSPTWQTFQAGEVTVPILLYHHVADTAAPNRFYVPPDVFREQMAYLQQAGYTPLRISQVVDVLRLGGQLPPRPVVITFDDGNMDVVQNAFPILQQFGFPAVMYVIVGDLQVENYLHADDVRMLANAGWEIGSHTISHTDLTADHAGVHHQLVDSRLTLEDILGVKVTTLAYPFGRVDPYVAQKAYQYGYMAAMGLGITSQHTLGSLYYLSRLEVYGTASLEEFKALLPWR